MRVLVSKEYVENGRVEMECLIPERKNYLFKLKKKKKNFWKHGGFIIVSQSQNSNYSFLFAIVMEIQDT